VPLVWLDAGFHREKILDREAPSLAADVLKYTRSYTAQADVRTVFLPFDLVPTMHYYLPNIPVTGYDTDWSNDRLAGESLNASPDLVLCRESACRTLEHLWPEGAVVHRAPVSRPPGGEPLNAIGLTDPGHR
jgi:hypothetical protein